MGAPEIRMMEHITIDAIDNRIQPAAVMRRLTDALGTTDLAINYYELEPGDSFAFAYHRHEHQEEVFYVHAGTATFETEEGPISVESGEAIRFEPGEYQRGWNRGDKRVVAIALGAPLQYGDGERLRECQNCGDRTDNSLDLVDDENAPGGKAVIAICGVCGTETGRWFEGSMPGTVP